MAEIAISSIPVAESGARKRTAIAALKAATPPVLFNAAKAILKQPAIEFRHGYASWADAATASSGYDSDAIIERVATATGRVRDGRAEYERDGMLFDAIEYSWPLLSALLLAAQGRQKLRVVDYGGALGSTFYQNRRFLSHLPEIDWRVVEQPRFVELGAREFARPGLSFHPTIAEAGQGGVDIVLFCGVLCCVPEPYEAMEAAAALNPAYIAIDRTPVAATGRDIFGVQTVRPPLYSAQYPVRSFARANLVPPGGRWRLLADWVCDLQPDPHMTAMGFLYER